MHCYIIIRKEERKKEKPACALLYNYKKGRKEERNQHVHCYIIIRKEERRKRNSMCIVI